MHAKKVKRMRDSTLRFRSSREGRNKHRHTAKSRTMGGSCMLTRRHANRLIPYRYYPTYSCDHRPCPCTAVRMNGTWYGLVQPAASAVCLGHVQRVSSTRLRDVFFAKRTPPTPEDGGLVVSRGDGNDSWPEAETPAPAALYEDSMARGSRVPSSRFVRSFFLPHP